MKSMTAWLGVILLGVSMPVLAEPPGDDRLGVLPLIGDEITVVAYRPSTGTHIDPNEKEVLPAPPDVFDRAALDGVRDGAARAEGDAVALLPGLASHLPPNAVVDGDRLVASPELASALAQAHVTRLVVLTPRRAPTQVRLGQIGVGSGRLEGVGFYIDAIKRTRRGDTGERGTGFLSAYAYFDVTLVDVATSSVIGRRAVEASRSLSGARSENGGDPWAVLTGDQKLAMLRTMVRRQTGKAVAALLADSPPR